MAYRAHGRDRGGGGGGGDPHPPHGRRVVRGAQLGSVDGLYSSVVRPPPASTTTPMDYLVPMAMHRQASYAQGPPPPVVHRAQAPRLLVMASPAPVPVAILVPPPTPPPSSTSLPVPAPAPRQPAHGVSASSTAPLAAALAKKMGKKPFKSETAVARPAAAGIAAVAASQEEAAAAAAADASYVDLAPVSKKGLVLPASPGQGIVGMKNGHNSLCLNQVGGRNTVLEETFLCKGIQSVPEVLSKTKLVASATTPQQPREDSASSIAVVVPSMDYPEIYKYRCLVSAQTHHHEMLEDLFTVSEDQQKQRNVECIIIREPLIPLHTKTNKRPERIIFLRDGASANQLSRVLLRELDTTNKVCASSEDIHIPPLTSVAVQKRHHLCRDDHCVPPVTMGPASFDTYLAMFCEHVYVDAESSSNRSAIGNTEQAAQEGLVEVGGRNTVLEETFLCKGIQSVPEVLSKTKLVASATTPQQPREDSASSIAVVVPSMDYPEIYKYRCLVSAQTHHHEMLEDLFTVSEDQQKQHNVECIIIREPLIPLHTKTNKRPERIIFLRDGASANQLSRVLLRELDTTNKVCASSEDIHIPPLTSVAVQKRHHLCRDDHCVPPVTMGPASFDTYLAMFCEHVYVDAESSSNRSAIGNTELAAQEGLVEVRQLPELKHTVKVSKTPSASVFVRMLDTVMEVPINEDASLEYVAHVAMMNLNVKLTDVYFTCNGRSVPTGTQLRNGCRLLTHHRLRGGYPTSTPITLRKKMEQLRRDKRLFHFVRIPSCMLSVGMQSVVVGLEEEARLILFQLSAFLESRHSNGLSFGGVVNLDDILFDPATQVVYIKGKDDRKLAQDNYILDEGVVKEVINTFFRYKETDGSLSYPIYVGNLVDRIDNLSVNGQEYLSTLSRSMIFLHPSVRSVSDRLGIPLKLMIHYHLLGYVDAQNFRNALGGGTATGSVSSNVVWKPALTRNGVSNVISKVLYFKTWDPHQQRSVPKRYPDDYFGRLDFIRCLITHARGYKVSEMVIDAVLFLIFENHLLDLQHMILSNYKKSANISVTSAAGGSAVTTGGAATAAVTTGGAATAAVTTGGAATAAVTTGGAATAGSSSGQLSYVLISDIDERVDLDLSVVFGFTQEP
ncbi:hypothetical protein ACP4OV_001703 [Aristida adscensionis]